MIGSHDNLHGSVGVASTKRFSWMSVSLSFSSSISFGQSRSRKGEQSLVRHGVASVHKLDELVADRCRYVILYIGKGGVADW